MMAKSNEFQARFLVGDIVLLRAASLQLLVYQSEIEHNDFVQNKLLAYQQDFLTDSTTPFANQAVEQPRCYIAIDAHLQTQQQAENRFLLTKFCGGQWLWVWDDVKIMLDVKLAIQNIPSRALSADSPLLGAVYIDNQVGFVSNAQLLENYILTHLRDKHA